VARGRSEYCAGHGGGSNCRFPDCPNVAVSNHIFCREHRRHLKRFGMNVLKEGKTYYLSSMNSQYPLIPCDEALRYLKFTLQSDTQAPSTSPPSPATLTPDLMTTYTPSDGYYTLPFSMIPIHTQSVLYPSMQYFPPLSSVLPSPLPISTSTPLMDSVHRTTDGEESDSSDESDELTVPSGGEDHQQHHHHFPSHYNHELSSHVHEPIVYELSPFQYYPVFPSATEESPHGPYSTLSSLPMILPSSSEINSSSQSGTFLSENPTVLLKRSREEFDNSLNQDSFSDPRYSMMLPHLLPSLTKTNA
jgi:hypothetical protein